MSSYAGDASVLRAVVNISRVSVDGITRLVREGRLCKEDLLEELRILALALSPQTIENMKQMPMSAPNGGVSPDTNS
jgi:hypothetical protein